MAKAQRFSDCISTERPNVIQRNSQAKVPVADLLDEYFRLRQAVRLLRDSSVLPFLAEIAAEKKSRPNSQLKKLFIANGAQVRAQVGKLLAFSAIDKRTFLRRMSDTFKKELWDSAAIEKLVVTLNSRCETIESTLSVFPPSIDKSRIYLAKSWEYFLYDLDGINLFSSSISDDHPNVNALLNELRADSIPTPQLGAEDIHSLAWYIFIEQFGRGEVKAQQWPARPS
jgi:hypothetical protein